MECLLLECFESIYIIVLLSCGKHQVWDMKNAKAALIDN